MRDSSNPAKAIVPGNRCICRWRIRKRPGTLLPMLLNQRIDTSPERKARRLHGACATRVRRTALRPIAHDNHDGETIRPWATGRKNRLFAGAPLGRSRAAAIGGLIRPVQPEIRMLIRTRIKFRHLQCFLEIVRQKSLTKAGDVLALTQPTISKTLSELEEELGVVLIKRSREGVLLTPQGREFHRYAGVCVASLRNGFEAIARGRNPEAEILHIGTLISVAARIMPDVIIRFRDSYPDSHIWLMTESNVTLLHKLRHGEIDMIIGRLPEPVDAVGFSFEPLYHESQLFVVRKSHPLLDAKNFSLQDVIRYPFIITGFQESVRQDVERFLAAQGIPLFEPTVAINNPDFGRHLLLKSDAIWCTPFGSVEQDIIAETLVTLPIDTTHLRATIGMTTRADDPLEGMSLAFADTVREIARALYDQPSENRAALPGQVK